MAKTIKTAQDIQDEVFRGMTADEKLEVWAGLWRLAKDLTSDKCLNDDNINHGTNGSKRAS